MYKAVHKVLEDVIAEERLPIPVEMVEDQIHVNSPAIRIDGHFIFKVKTGHGFEHLRDVVQKKWSEINNFAKHRM